MFPKAKFIDLSSYLSIVQNSIIVTIHSGMNPLQNRDTMLHHKCEKSLKAS